MIITLQTLIFFRESLLKALDRLLRPYYNKLSLALSRKAEDSEDEESDDQVFAEYDDERGVVFYPPMYLQRYAAISDCLMDGPWSGKLEKVVDLGYHDMSFIKYLKEVQGIKSILGVDLETIPLRCSMDLIGSDDYVPKRENPLEVTLFKGNAADPDYRLIGCDAVIAIEMIEHMLPHDLDRLIHTIFGFIKPWVAIFTTPNGDFNVLFKALEKNGLRRLDHFFEWSREQFHDWCSNIVVRYPQYTVSCKGIGPGPNGTKHLGCCSQMAVFVAKEYVKQQDLNINSLALVSDTPSPLSVSNLISSWETCEVPNESNMIEPPNNAESYSELRSDMQSSITILLTTASNSYDTILYQDKMSQCDLDSETEKGYLMFDYEQMCFDMLEPNRNLEIHRVYDIEDVYNRLNCTTLEVKKFSKATQNLMAKNKVDTLVHTREVVDEIKHLTKMLNFSKEMNNQLENGTHTWCNINWGENAPYWNQYYKIVKAYNYPFEVKSEECRILDLISDEINRLIDSQYDEDFSFEVNRMEIPIEHLMKEVAHITEDVDKVKDILEWNGYEVQGNVVVHSRMVVDYSSAGTQEEDSLETSDIYSDWDSTSVSDGSTIVLDYHARCLRRALDQKVRRLRSMLTADEDITTELDRVVCRLMKLALRTSKGRNTPPPTRWMQCKLLDLLTLTEKTIERRKRHFIESYQLKAINFEEKSQEMIALEKIKEDDTALKIVDKYKHLVNETDDTAAKYRYLDFDLEDLTDSSTDFAKDYEFIDENPECLGLLPQDTVPDIQIFQVDDLKPQGESKLERTQAWLEEEIEVVPYPVHDGILDNSSVETEHIATNTITKYYKKRYKGKQCIEINCLICKKTHSRSHKHHKVEQKTKDNNATKLGKKMIRKKPSNQSLGLYTTHKKYVSLDYRASRTKSRRKQHKQQNPNLTNSVPANLMKLCHPEVMLVNKIEISSPKAEGSIKPDQQKASYVLESDVAATKESMFVEIITENTQDTIALRRTIGTEADAGSVVFEDEMLIRSVSNTLMKDDEVQDKTENVHSQTIFLYDIDEPTTSKGIRHVSMDVQCGPDSTIPSYSMLSATTSLTKVTKMYTTGIKIGNPTSKITSVDLGTCTYDVDNNYTALYGNRSFGIKIKDSDINLLIYDTDLSTISGNSKTEMGKMNYKAGTNTPEYILNSTCSNNICVGNKNNNSSTNIPMQEGSVEVSEICFNKPICSLSQKHTEETISKSKSNEGETDSTSINMACTISTQQMYDKIIVSSHKLFLKESTKLQEASSYLDCKDLEDCKNLQTEHPLSFPRNNGSNKIFSKQTLSKNIQKKTVEFQLQDPTPYNFQRVKAATENISLLEKSKSKAEKGRETKKPDSFCEFKLDMVTEMEPSTTSEFDNIPATPNVSRHSLSMNSSRTQVIITGNKIDNKRNSTVCIIENQECDGSHVAEQFSEEITCLKSHVEMNIDDSTSDTCFSLGSVGNTVTSISQHNSNLQAESKVNHTSENSGWPAAGCPTRLVYVKRKLANGGVQVHSYKDQQELSEDIMCQGQWQKNKSKSVTNTKRKCILPLSTRKNDPNSKKLLKELTKSNVIKENVSIKDIDKVTKDMRECVLPCNLNCSNLKQEQSLNTPKKVCVATVAKPFRNILKVPSKFPISHLPRKNLNSPFIIKKPPITSSRSSTPPVPKDEKSSQKKLRKNYIPPYLRRRILNATNRVSENDTILSSRTTKQETNNKENKKYTENVSKILVRSNTDEINHDLLKFQTKLSKHEYVVFRNEIEKKSDRLQLKNTSDSVRRKDASRQRVSTPNSANSSTCSSPCSIATVRAVTVRTKNATTRRLSGPSYINSTENSGSENSTPERNKKFIKRIKCARITVENKENIPETSKHFSVTKKESAKIVKGNIIGHKKNVYMVQVKEGSINSTINALPRHKNQISDSNDTTKSYTDTKSSPHSSSPISNKSSVMLDISLSATRSNEISVCSQTSNMVVVIEPQPRQMQIPEPISMLENSKTTNKCIVSEKLEDAEKDIGARHSTQNIHSDMRCLIEESLDFIDDLLDDNIDSKTVILKRENSPQDDLPASPASFKTVITSNDNYMNELLPSDIEYALNRSVDTEISAGSALSLNDTGFPVADFDAISFKSVTSSSKLSGYLSADNEFSSSIKFPKCTNHEPSSTSVCDLFERKDQLFQPSQNVSGVIANQTFSGFTINEDPVAGDQPELINLVDPETGILTAAIVRQTTSEELLVSGRSSSSFDSCVLDDGAVVPNWLFQIISQQESGLADLDAPPEVMVQGPMAEPLYDDNGNVMEAPGAGAGAGDGRGIHSDHSQDSSGNGTSVSSSETSSGPQSEALLIDPSAFVAQFEMLRESVDGSITVLAIDNAEPSDNVTRQAVSEAEQQSFSRGEPRRTRAQLTSASDVDADISSLETDVEDHQPTDG